MATIVLKNTAGSAITLKSFATQATSTASLTNVDETTADAGLTGTALVYDSATSSYKAEKIFNYIDDTPELNGGDF